MLEEVRVLDREDRSLRRPGDRRELHDLPVVEVDRGEDGAVRGVIVERSGNRGIR